MVSLQWTPDTFPSVMKFLKMNGLEAELGSAGGREEVKAIQYGGLNKGREAFLESLKRNFIKSDGGREERGRERTCMRAKAGGVSSKTAFLPRPIPRTEEWSGFIWAFRSGRKFHIM